LLSSVVVLVDFLDRHELGRTPAHDVKRAIRAVESYGTLVLALALEGFVVGLSGVLVKRGGSEAQSNFVALQREWAARLRLR